MKAAIALLALMLAGCGASRGLEPAPGKTLPVAPYGVKSTPTAKDLLIPGNQTRPERSDELLKSSDQRRSDEFDLPPSN